MAEVTGNVAFIGLGAMGYGMATNIRRKVASDVVMYVYDLSAQLCERFENEMQTHGPIKVVESPREAAENASYVISIVPGADDVRKVYLDPSTGVIAAPSNKERLMLECSTIDSSSTRTVGRALLSGGAGIYVDTPVSGGVPAADSGTLSFLIGHSKPAENDPISLRLEKIITLMGNPEKFFYCGKLGAGLAAKISNNYLSCSILLATAEAMAIGVKSGIDKQLLHDVIQNSSGRSWMADNVQPVPGVVPHAPSSNDYRLGFKTQMMIKDLTLGVDAGRATGIYPSIAEAALRVYEKAAIDPRCIDRDASSVYLYISDTPNE